MNKTNQNSTKRSLYASIVSLVLCVAMLVGSTFAWFTDNVTTGMNTIATGNLDVGLEYSYDMASWENAASKTEIFNPATKWEPGYAEVVYFKVTNLGDLAFYYQIGTKIGENIIGKNQAGGNIDITKALQFGIVKTDATFADRDAAVAAVTSPLSFSEMYAEKTSLDATGDFETFAMVVWLPENIGNEFNHDGVNKPSVKFGVQVIASQKPFESDRFGTDYDAESLLSNERLAKSDEELAAILADTTGVDRVYLGAGTFNAVNTRGMSVNFIGSTDASGNPTTKFYISEAPGAITDPGIWSGFNGSVSNIIFEAADGVANDTTHTYGLYGAFSLGHGDDNALANATFNNCQFINQGVRFVGDVDFYDCVFDGKGHVEKNFNTNCVVGTSTLDNCEIKGYTVLSYNAQDSADGSVVIRSSNITDAGIEIGALDSILFEGNALDCNVVVWLSMTETTFKNNVIGTNFSTPMVNPEWGGEYVEFISIGNTKGGVEYIVSMNVTSGVIYVPGEETEINGNNWNVVIPAATELKTTSGEIASATNIQMSAEKLATVDGNVQVVFGQTAETYEIDLTTVDGDKITATNGKITVSLQIGAGRENVTLYHNDTKIDSTYNSETGIITFETDSFSPFTVVETLDEIVINTADELYAFAAYVNSGSAFTNKVIKLGADIDLAGENWTPINGWDGVLNGTVIDGQGHTIKNMTVDGGNSAGFISDNASSVTIKNITFDNAYVKTTDGNSKYAGVVMGKNYSVATIENVNVVNSQVRCTWQCGGLVGFAEGNAPVFINCSIEDSFVGGYNCTAGAFFGLGGVDVTVTDCTAKNVQLYTDMDAGFVGYLYGRTLTNNNSTMENVVVVSEYPAE